MPEPAGLVPILACLLILLCVFKLRRFLACGAFALGFAWGSLYAWAGLAQGLPEHLAGTSQQVCGTVTGLPRASPEFTRFHLRLEASPGVGGMLAVWQGAAPTLRLSWYEAPEIRPDDRVCAQVRLRQPGGLSNPGGFDYERYLFARNLYATGTVKRGFIASSGASGPGFFVDRLRDQLRTNIRNQLQADPLAASVFPALILGDRSAIQTATRETLQATGTSHLLAISGLHIGLLAGFCFMLGRWLALLFGLHRVWPVQRFSACFALAGALAYGLLAGFGIPVQRALIMLACGLLPVLLGHQSRPADIFCLALLLVLLRDPLAAMDPGFWLSFGAVLVLMVAFAGRKAMGGVWWVWGRAQWVLLIGMLPLLAASNLPVAWLSPLTNLIAVPVVGMLVVPVALLAAAVSVVSITVSGWLFALAAEMLNIVWGLLVVAAEWGGTWTPAGFDLPRLLLAMLGALWLLMPRGVPLRCGGVMLLLPLWLPVSTGPQHGDFEARVLDVGQGLSVLVRTREHALLYDTGIGGSGFDMGTAAIVPVMRRGGLKALDRVVLSHADHDHSGGFAAVARHVQVHSLMANHAMPGFEQLREACRAPTGWSWDGVSFDVLHPRVPERFAKENNRSCVIRVEGRNWSLLLAGDLERGAEYQLLAHEFGQLQSDVLIAPHHGSQTSSAPMFVAAVDPGHVVYSASSPSRFGHPHSSVVERYEQEGVVAWNTGRHGAIRFRGGVEGSRVEATAWRSEVRRYWQRKSGDAGPHMSMLESLRSEFWSGFLQEVG